MNRKPGSALILLIKLDDNNNNIENKLNWKPTSIFWFFRLLLLLLYFSFLTSKQNECAKLKMLLSINIIQSIEAYIINKTTKKKINIYNSMRIYIRCSDFNSSSVTFKSPIYILEINTMKLWFNYYYSHFLLLWI